MIMKFSEREGRGGVIIVELEGRMDSEGVSQIEDRLSEISAMRRGLVIDMCRVDYMASLGIRKLLQTAKSLATSGKKLALVSPQSLVLGVLKVANIDSVIAILPNIDEAADFVK